jgi:hypothetical protein
LVRDPDQLDESVGRRNLAGKSCPVQGITRHADAAGGQLFFRALAHERAHAVPPCKQKRNQTPADITGSAGDEDGAMLHAVMLADEANHSSE